MVLSVSSTVSDSGTVSVLLMLLVAMGIALGLVVLTGIHK